MSVLTDFPQADVFVETGTGKGATTVQAMQRGFREVHTIESDPAMQQRARAVIGHTDNVTMHLGDSVDVLGYLLPQLHGSVAFWLDAHWCGGSFEESRPTVECPLLAELAVIVGAHWTVPPVVLIDDAQMFGDNWWRTDPRAPRFTRQAWPSLYDVLAAAPGWSATLRSPDVVELRP